MGSLEVFICGELSPKFTIYKIKANGALTRENQNANNKNVEKSIKKHDRSKTLTHNHPKEEIEGGREEESEDSSVPIFPPPKFRNCEIVD